MSGHSCQGSARPVLPSLPRRTRHPLQSTPRAGRVARQTVNRNPAAVGFSNIRKHLQDPPSERPKSLSTNMLKICHLNEPVILIYSWGSHVILQPQGKTPLRKFEVSTSPGLGPDRAPFFLCFLIGVPTDTRLQLARVKLTAATYQD